MKKFRYFDVVRDEFGLKWYSPEEEVLTIDNVPMSVIAKRHVVHITDDTICDRLLRGIVGGATISSIPVQFALFVHLSDQAGLENVPASKIAFRLCVLVNYLLDKDVGEMSRIPASDLLELCQAMSDSYVDDEGMYSYLMSAPNPKFMNMFVVDGSEFISSPLVNMTRQDLKVDVVYGDMSKGLEGVYEHYKKTNKRVYVMRHDPVSEHGHCRVVFSDSRSCSGMWYHHMETSLSRHCVSESRGVSSGISHLDAMYFTGSDVSPHEMSSTLATLYLFWAWPDLFDRPVLKTIPQSLRLQGHLVPYSVSTLQSFSEGRPGFRNECLSP